MSIRLSPKHGVNPAIPKCFYCNEDKNELILTGRIKDDVESPKNVIWDMHPCDRCAEFMQQGVILISTMDGEMEKIERDYEIAQANYERDYGHRALSWKKKHPFNYVPNPFRTGGWVVITDDGIRRAFTGAIVDQVLTYRWSFVPDEVWDAVGLPREEIEAIA